MEGLHANWVYVAVAATGAVGLWGIVLAALRRNPGRLFRPAAYGATVAMLVQIGLGLILFSDDAHREAADSFHVFYGMVVLFTFAFLYIFRAQAERRPALVWGIALLFVMGLGIRAWTIAA